jgi:hypothetical protein
MSITIVQSAFNPAFHAGSGTATVTLTNPVTSGNAVLIGFAGNDSQTAKTVGTITDDKSNTGYSTLTFDNTAPVDGQGWFILTNVTNGPSTFDVPFTTSSAANIIIGVYEISGLLASPGDFANTLTSGFSTTFNLAITTTVANELGFAILSNSNGSGQTAVTLTNGWTADFTDLTGSTFFSVFAHMALPTAGSGNSIQGSTASADEWNVSIVSLKPSTTAANTAPIAWIT